MPRVERGGLAQVGGVGSQAGAPLALKLTLGWRGDHRLGQGNATVEEGKEREKRRRVIRRNSTPV